MKRPNIFMPGYILSIIASLLLVTACIGSSDDPSADATTDMVTMFSYLGYSDIEVFPGYPQSAKEALANNKTKINKLEIKIISEKCGQSKEPIYTGAGIGNFITIPKSQVDLAKMIGYLLYTEEQKWNFDKCPY